MKLEGGNFAICKGGSQRKLRDAKEVSLKGRIRALE